MLPLNPLYILPFLYFLFSYLWVKFRGGNFLSEFTCRILSDRNKTSLDRNCVNEGPIQTWRGCQDLNPSRVRTWKFGQSDPFISKILKTHILKPNCFKPNLPKPSNIYYFVLLRLRFMYDLS